MDQPKKVASIGKRNRTKGHNGERLYAQKFREMGFPHCVTSRFASKMNDDAKIDLSFIPVNVQIKVGFKKGVRPSAILREMKEAIKRLIPPTEPQHSSPNILIHHMDCPPGKSREDTHTIVSMTWEDFAIIFQKAYKNSTP